MPKIPGPRMAIAWVRMVEWRLRRIKYQTERES